MRPPFRMKCPLEPLALVWSCMGLRRGGLEKHPILSLCIHIGAFHLEKSDSLETSYPPKVSWLSFSAAYCGKKHMLGLYTHLIQIVFWWNSATLLSIVSGNMAFLVHTWAVFFLPAKKTRRQHFPLSFFASIPHRVVHNSLTLMKDFQSNGFGLSGKQTRKDLFVSSKFRGQPLAFLNHFFFLKPWFLPSRKWDQRVEVLMQNNRLAFTSVIWIYVHFFVHKWSENKDTVANCFWCVFVFKAHTEWSSREYISGNAVRSKYWMEILDNIRIRWRHKFSKLRLDSSSRFHCEYQMEECSLPEAYEILRSLYVTR